MNNSSSNTTVELSLEELSMNGLKTQLVFTVVIYVILAFFTLVSNILTLFVLIKGKESFRSNHYKLVIHMSLVSGAQALYIVLISGLLHVFQVILNLPDYGTKLRCAFVLMFLEISLTVDQISVLIVAVDRFMAVVSPFLYKTLSRSKLYLIVILSTVYLFSVSDACAKLLLYSQQFANEWLHVCIMPNTRTPEYLSYRYIRGICLASVTVAFYLGAIVIAEFHIRFSNHGSQQLKKELGYRLLVASGADAVVYTFTYFLGQIYQYIIIPTASVQARSMLGPIGLGFNLLCSTPRFFVFMYLNKDFRKFAKIYVMRQAVVTNVSSMTKPRKSVVSVKGTEKVLLGKIVKCAAS